MAVRIGMYCCKAVLLLIICSSTTFLMSLPSVMSASTVYPFIKSSLLSKIKFLTIDLNRIMMAVSNS